MRIAFALLIALAACGGSKKTAKTPANADTTAPREEAAPAPGGAEQSTTGNGDADDSSNDPKTSNEDPCQGGE